MNDFIWLASFPKSGNTYTRFVFANIINLQVKAYSEINFYNLGKIMHEDGKDSLLETWHYQKILPKLIKTHRLPNEISWEAGTRSIYIIRDPRDTMLSYYHYLSNRLKNSLQGTFEELLEHKSWGVGALNSHYEKWIERTDMIVKYEDLMTEPFGVFRSILQYLEVVIDDSVLQKAIDLSDPVRLRRIEDKMSRPNHADNFVKSYRFVRNASVMQWKTQLSEDASAKVLELCSKTVKVYYE